MTRRPAISPGLFHCSLAVVSQLLEPFLRSSCGLRLQGSVSKLSRGLKQLPCGRPAGPSASGGGWSRCSGLGLKAPLLGATPSLWPPGNAALAFPPLCRTHAEPITVFSLETGWCLVGTASCWSGSADPEKPGRLSQRPTVPLFLPSLPPAPSLPVACDSAPLLVTSGP